MVREENTTPGQGRAVRQPNPAAAARADIPAGYLQLYRAAAKQHCPGLSWTILAGVGKVESNHGRAQLPGVRSGLNSAGCCAGPMQFNLTDGPPSTWAKYGRGSPYDPRTAIPAAARKLCAGGAAHPGGLVRAVAGYYGGTTANPPTAAYVAHVRCAARAYDAGTIRELVQALTKLAGELPRGLDTPVEVGLIVDPGTFDASAAFSVEPVTATWPNFRPDGTECRHTTLCLIGDPGHPDADRYTRHEPGPTGHPDWEDPQPTDPHGSSERRADPGERCTCGRQAIVVYLGGAFGPTGHCGISDGGDRTGPCPFCGGPRHSELEGRCPRHRLRLDAEREE